MSEENGVWRTISGRRVFIKDGQSLTDAMRESGKFKGQSSKRIGHVSQDDFYDALPDNGYEKMLDALNYYTEDYYDALDSEDKVNSINAAIEAAETIHWNEGELYRGLSVDEDFVNSLKEGVVIGTGLPSSWTSEESTAIEFAEGKSLDEAAGTRVMLIDKTSGSRNAISIRAISRYPDEDEVLYHGKSSFRVLDVSESEYSGGTYYRIEVEEVA